MNLVDYVVLFVLALTILGGVYRGFAAAAVSLMTTVVCFLAALLCVGPVAGTIRSNEQLYSMLEYYTEGDEYVIKSDVELAALPVEQTDRITLQKILLRAAMPYPMEERVKSNISSRAFQKRGLVTLGQYFNETVIRVALNIVAMGVVFLIIRPILGFIVQCAARALGGYPAMVRTDGLCGGLVGLFHGVSLVFFLFLAAPLILVILPSLEILIEESFFGSFFYYHNPLLSLIPGA